MLPTFEAQVLGFTGFWSLKGSPEGWGIIPIPPNIKPPNPPNIKCSHHAVYYHMLGAFDIRVGGGAGGGLTLGGGDYLTYVANDVGML